MIFDMTRRVSGGGGPSSSDAILTVTVPTGSTVTMTKGGITLTPTMWAQAADNTLDCALFVIAPSLFDAVNAWTVTATLGTESASDTVTINSNKQYDLELFYAYYFIKNGIVLDTFSITYGTLTSGQSGYALFKSGTEVSMAKKKIDITGYSCLSITIVDGLSYSGYQTPAIGFSDSSPAVNISYGSVAPYTAYTRLTTNSGSNEPVPSGTYEVDFSNSYGSKWIWMTVGDKISHYLHISDFYLR